MMRISEKGITLIKEFEGCSLTAYPDPGTGGDPWTIGYGWTHSVDGKPVKPGMMIPEGWRCLHRSIILQSATRGRN